MTLKDALGFVIDYSKFIATLWSAYIGVILAMVGWLVTLRSKDLPLDDPARYTLIAAFVGLSAIFIMVLQENHKRLTNLMRVVDKLAEIEGEEEIDGKKEKEGKKIEGKKKVSLKETYADVFQTGNTPILLNFTAFVVVPLVAVLVSLFICFITSPK